MIGDAFIADLELAELQSISLGNGDHIPTLAQVLDEFAGKMYLEIHLQSDTRELVAAVCEMIRQYPQLNDMFELTSFEPAIIQAIHELNQSIACDLLFRTESWMTDEMAIRMLIDKARLARPRGVHLFPHQINANSLARFKALGFEVHCGVLNDSTRYPQIKALGVTQVLTDNIWLYIQNTDS